MTCESAADKRAGKSSMKLATAPTSCEPKRAEVFGNPAEFRPQVRREIISHSAQHPQQYMTRTHSRRLRAGTSRLRPLGNAPRAYRGLQDWYFQIVSSTSQVLKNMYNISITFPGSALLPPLPLHADHLHVLRRQPNSMHYGQRSFH